MIYFLVPAAGEFTISEYLRLDGPATTARFRVILYEDLPTRTKYYPGTYVLAGLDQLSPAMNRLAVQLCESLRESPGVRMLNHPGRTLRRFDLLRKLHQLHRNDFGVARAGEDLSSLRYPVFLRGERSHDGAISPLLHSLRQVEQAIGRALIQGHSFDDLLVVEFCSTVDQVGLFRKYAAFIVGKQVIARSLEHGRQWMLKLDESEFTRPLVLEEHDYVFNNPHAIQLAEIFEIAGIDYGRIDYSIKDGRIQTWEINLNATIGRGVGPSGGKGPAELRPLRSETREYFFDRFREAWDAADALRSAESPVFITFDDKTVAEAAARPIPNRRFLESGRAILRPLKPVLEPLSAPFLRVIGILMRKVYRSLSRYKT